MEVHEIVKKVYKELGLSQVQLAESLNIAQPQISYAINGANPTTLGKIIKYLMEEHDVDRAIFYPNQDERLSQIEDRLSSMEEIMINLNERLGQIIKDIEKTD